MTKQFQQSTARDAESMAICAIRYTIGRRSYVVSEGQQWAREWGARSKWVRDVIRRDLREACERHGALGDQGDEAGWRNVLTDLDNMEPANGACQWSLPMEPANVE